MGFVEGLGKGGELFFSIVIIIVNVFVGASVGKEVFAGKECDDVYLGFLGCWEWSLERKETRGSVEVWLRYICRVIWVVKILKYYVLIDNELLFWFFF